MPVQILWANRAYEEAPLPTMRLTERQAEVLLALAHGLSHNGVGRQLGIAINTVHAHAVAIRLALGVANTEAAIYTAMNAHLIA